MELYNSLSVQNSTPQDLDEINTALELIKMKIDQCKGSKGKKEFFGVGEAMIPFPSKGLEFAE